MLEAQLQVTRDRLTGCFTVGLSGMQCSGHGGSHISGWENVGPVVASSATCIEALEQTRSAVLEQLVRLLRVAPTQMGIRKAEVDRVSALLRNELKTTEERLRGCFTDGLSGMQCTSHAGRCISGWGNVGPVVNASAVAIRGLEHTRATILRLMTTMVMM
eukprot:TRINITY_DN2402_c0_g1_i4.p2 TRINITY_DN2402_c0_g1~~TRINITY_DN2402_c0_g1_i4.p2  ORF type:complete len:160 (-),score=33.70 TRINITY_DN2402_c0_g1_i4:153-632(-)